MIKSLNKSTIDEVARLIQSRGNVVALTGAGISVESGIPDFRSSGGLWTKYNPLEYATIEAFRNNPGKVWNLFLELSRFDNFLPNEGHGALDKLEKMGILKAVITQNIDSLHSVAGNNTVIELHGNIRVLHCIECNRELPKSLITDAGTGSPPICPHCGGLVKPAVILFGEALPQNALKMACDLAQSAKVLLTVGTSATVSPANIIPKIAKENGAAIVEVNLEETTLTGTLTDYFLQGSSSQVLKLLVNRLVYRNFHRGFCAPEQI